MSMNDFIANIKTFSHEDFTDDQLQLLKVTCTDLYKLLKNVFDKPRRDRRSYTSLEAYKLSRSRKLHNPDVYHNFKDDNVEIHIQLRHKTILSVAVHGFIPHSLLSFKDTLSKTEEEFSCGYTMYGRFPLSEFNSCLSLYYSILLSYLLPQVE